MRLTIALSAALIAACAVIPASAALAQADGAALAPYRINPGDELEIYVWGDERLQRVLRVLPDGSFAFPLVGQVAALGKLPREIEAVISKGLEAQYRGTAPQVTVSVRMPAGLQFTVVGKVRSPGSFSPGRYVNLLEAMGFAGGPTEFADVGNVVILRKQPNGGVERIRVRLNDALKGQVSETMAAQGIPQLVTGDTVIVP